MRLIRDLRDMSTGKVHFTMLRSHGILTLGPTNCLVWPYSSNQQHAIGCLVGDWGTTKSKNCLKVRLYVLNKNGLLYCYHWVSCSCLFSLMRLIRDSTQTNTQQMSNSYFGYTLLQKKFHRARLYEFKKVGKFVTF